MQSSNTARRHLALVATSNGVLPRYLFKRNGAYYFKRKIPVDVAQGFPEYGEQVWKSLYTKWLEAAKVRLAVEVTEFELKVAQLRRERAMRQAAVQLALVGPTARKSSEALGAKPAFALATLTELVVHAPPTPAPLPKLSGPGRPSMLHLFEDWRRKQTRHRTINAVEAAVLEFRTLHGLLAVEDIAKGHARAYRDSLVDRQLSKGTVENRLGFLATLVRHGMKEMVEHLGMNPFERIEVTAGQGVRRPKDRRAYAVAELNVLYASRLYTDGYRPEGQVVDAAYWAPLLGPFVGARIEEVCQFRVEDVQRVNGAWCIRICGLALDQTIKTPGSFRRVPLHHAVIRSGFLLYAARVARAGHERLFPTLSNENANRIYSNSVGKWFGRYLESIGLVDHRLDYHSFRYTFRQQASLCGIDNEVRDALTGHWLSHSDSGRTYMKAENRQYLTTLTDLFAHWEKSQARRRTIDTYRGYVQDFEAVHGALPVVAISKQHVLAFHDSLAGQGLVRATVSNRVKGLMTLVAKGVADQEVRLDSNPFAGIDFDCVPETPASEVRRPYYVEELQQLFNSKLYTSVYRPEGQTREALYWAPLLGAFAGPRIEELAQLTVGDVRTVQGVWVLCIVNLDPEQHLKNDSSYRTGVP